MFNLDLKIDENRFAIYLITALALLIPGIAILYLDERDIFFSTEVVKIILLALFYSTPLFTLALYVSLLDRKPHNLGIFLTESGLFTLMSLALGILLHFLAIKFCVDQRSIYMIYLAPFVIGSITAIYTHFKSKK